MKAVEVIQEYKNGRRDFRGESLRGCNFKNQDFSGADFSGCDIRGANFSGANLTEAKFKRAKCGYSKFSLIKLTFLLVFSYIAYLFYYIFSDISLKRLEVNLDISKESIYYQIINNTILYLSFFSLILFIPILWVMAHHFKNKRKIKNYIDKLTPFINYSLFVFFAILAFPIMTGLGSLNELIFTLIYFSINFIQVFTFFGIRITNNIILNFVIELELDLQLSLFSGLIFILIQKTGDYISNIFIDDDKVSLVTGSGSFYLSLLIVVLLILVYDPYKFNGSLWNCEVRISKIISTTFGTSFRESKLQSSDFSDAYLKCCNFSNSVIDKICLNNSHKTYLSYFGSPPLRSNNIISLMCNLNSRIDLDLSHEDISNLDLANAQLENCNLSYANLREAVLINANLKNANLTEVNAVNADLSYATLTGACVENWNIDATTQLAEVDCQYIYLLNNQKERRPSSGEFEPGEFTQLFEEVFDTVDLIFRDGMDWKALMNTLKEVQVQNEDTPLQVQAIENKGNGVFVVKVHVPPDANKEKIHQEFTEIYQIKAQLEAKDEQLKFLREQNTDLTQIIKIQAQNQAKVEISYNKQDHSQTINVGQDLTITAAQDSTVNLRDINSSTQSLGENHDHQ